VHWSYGERKGWYLVWLAKNEGSKEPESAPKGQVVTSDFISKRANLGWNERNANFCGAQATESGKKGGGKIVGEGERCQEWSKKK